MLNMKTTCKRQKLRMDYTDSCPSMCKCSINSPNTNNNDSMFNMKKNMIANYAEMNYSILARCWITSDLIFLECTPKWNILHLQILNDYKEYSKDLKYTNNDIHIEPSINLFHKCKSIERLAIWEKSQINYLSNSLFKPLTNLTRLIIQLPMLYYLPSHFLFLCHN
ncbi:unnamed protein product [Heterobilharzia americana]|nr:unnamed protein product [Heterobilharzia americana]